jgi:hypothetical protein
VKSWGGRFHELAWIVAARQSCFGVQLLCGSR